MRVGIWATLGWLLLTAVPDLAIAERRMDLTDCVAHGLEHSLPLRNASLDAVLARWRGESAAAPFDPRVTASLSYSDSQLPEPDSFLSGDRRITGGNIEVAKGFATGTRLGLSLAHSHIDLTGPAAVFLTEPYATSLTLTLSQSLLRNAFGVADRARLAAARLGSDAARHAYERERRILAARIGEAYWGLFAAERNYAAGRDTLHRAEALRDTSRARVADGLADETDRLAAEALVAVRRAETRAVSNAFDHAADRLRNVIQLPPAQWASTTFVFPETPPSTVTVPESDSDTMLGRVLRRRSDVQALRCLESQAERDLAAWRSEARPELRLIGRVGRGAEGAARTDSLAFDEDGWMLGIQAEWPWRSTLERSRVEQARAWAEQAVNRRRALEEAVAVECAAARRGLRAAQLQVADTATVRELQKRKWERERETFEQGRSSSHRLIQYEDDHARARVAHNLALADYQLALIAYHLATESEDESLSFRQTE